MIGIDGDARRRVLVFEDGAPGVRAARAAEMEGPLLSTVDKKRRS